MKRNAFTIFLFFVGSFFTAFGIVIKGPTIATSGSSPALIASVIGGGGANGGTTGSIDTTGANLLVAHVSSYEPGGAVTVSDSKGNTWTPLTQQNLTSARGRLYYCYGGTVGSSHTFTTAGTGVYSTIAVVAFSNASASPFDTENGNTATVWGTMQTGSVTPSQANTILVVGISSYRGDDVGTLSIDSGFTIAQQQERVPDTSLPNAIAYLIATSSGARNPTLDYTNTPDEGAATIAVFKY